MAEDPPTIDLAYPNAIGVLNKQIRILEEEQAKAQLSFDILKYKIEPRQTRIDELKLVVEVLRVVEKE